ncbi:MAG: HD domain-containing protein [Erysipelotrichaceae bacterium]|nr:HD domain-containing protein [Erysipelotrichaceae bacterium]
MSILEKAEAFLKESFAESAYFKEHPSEGEYRLQHSYRVANIGKMIAEAEGFPVEEFTVACLLHDIAYRETFTSEEDWKNHGRRSAEITRPFLLKAGVDAKLTEELCYGIAIHVDDEADFEHENTPMALSIQDADNIDRIDAYRIYETLQVLQFSEMPYDQKKKLVDQNLINLEDYLQLTLATPSATKLWRERIGFYQQFYQKLQNQLNSSKEIL